MFSTGFTSLSYFFFLYGSSSSSLCTVFDAIEVIPIKPSANRFIFGDFQVHHKDYLTYSGGTDRPGELCHNFSQMTLCRWLTFFLGLFLSSDTSICSTMAFPPLENSDHVVVSVSIDFPANSKSDNHFIIKLMTILILTGTVFMAFERLEDIFKLGASAAASEICELIQIGIDEYIPYCIR